MRVISLKVDEELLYTIDEYARRKRISRSELIRRAIRDYISENESRPYITRRVKVY